MIRFSINMSVMPSILCSPYRLKAFSSLPNNGLHLAHSKPLESPESCEWSTESRLPTGKRPHIKHTLPWYSLIFSQSSTVSLKLFQRCRSLALSCFTNLRNMRLSRRNHNVVYLALAIEFGKKNGLFDQSAVFIFDYLAFVRMRLDVLAHSLMVSERFWQI